MRKIVVDSIQNSTSSSSISFAPSQSTATGTSIFNATNNRFEDAPIPSEVSYFHGPENSSAVNLVTIPLYDGSDRIGHRRLRIFYDDEHATTDSGDYKCFDFVPRDSSNNSISLTQTTHHTTSFYNNWSDYTRSNNYTDKMRLTMGLHNTSTDYACNHMLDLNIYFEDRTVLAPAPYYQFVLHGTAITFDHTRSSLMMVNTCYSRGQVTTAPTNLTFAANVGTNITNNPITFKVIDLYTGT
jgi:hypothetical protein